MKNHLPTLLLALLSPLGSLCAQNLPVVPYPQDVKLTEGSPFILKKGFSIKSNEDFAPAAKLFLEDVDALYDIKGRYSDSYGLINLVKIKDLGEEEYQLVVTSDGIIVKASNYKAIVMGLTTLLQMVEGKTKSIATCSIKDSPAFGYRAYMLDVARQWNELETIKNMVDLCRWYKVPYLQLHLTDDQQFTFESKHFPQLTEGKKHYTQEQLKHLVDYATQRGVTIIPEFDLPGHSSAMRRQMPELFGEPSWNMIDIANPKTMEAVKLITKEMMDIFHTSPYFHIGADEVNLGAYANLDHVKAYLAENKDSLDGVHDIYLQFIVEMHEFVKANGKQTMVWESFSGDGSKKVKVPTDMFVHAWETLYQRPESLIKHGFTIINSTWKPCYMTPGIRWSPEYIYKWNPRRWENHWSAAPSYHTPIQLEDNTQLMGLQMNAWEMIDYDQVLTAHERIAAFSENAWNDEKKQTYEDYAPRARSTDRKVMQLIFPAVTERVGFKDEDPRRLNHNQINYFYHEASIFLKPLDPSMSIYYTTDNSMPTTASTKMVEPLTMTRDKVVKYGMFNDKGELVAYKSAKYVLEHIEVAYEGLDPMRDPRGSGVHRRTFKDSFTITLTNHMPDTELYYWWDGREHNDKSFKYEGPVTIDKSVNFRAGSLDKNRKLVGERFYAEYTKVEEKK